jgi:AcrR family transcriptional regulator
MADSSDRSVSEPNEEIMRATYRALCEHGYADLTIKRIAEECGKSTAAIHYHYDTKDDLLAAFLEYLLDEQKRAIHEIEVTEPERRLDLLIDQLLVGPEEHRDLLVAGLEMWSQAPFEEEFSERIQKHDEYIHYMLKTVIDQGVEAGVFADVDTDHVANTLMTIANGTQMRAAVFSDSNVSETARRAADEYVDAVLLDG